MGMRGTIAPAVGIVVLALLVASSVTNIVVAASPAPSASAEADSGAYPNLEAWLDRATRTENSASPM